MTYTFKLEQPDGTPADPPQITLGADRSLRVVDVRDQGEDEPMVLVVEDTS